MGKSLNLDVLAEGIETQKQLEFLKNSKCGEGQGYYFSKPMSAEELEVLLKQAAQMEEDVT
jgi:EAL domain-containing protein (putative c-di-GMP-specific phosphodiesterase class I)